MSRTTPSEAPQPARRWASRNDVAAYLGIAPRTLDDLVNRGELPAYRLVPKMFRLDLNEVGALMVPLGSPADRLPIRPSVRKFRNGTIRDTRKNGGDGNDTAERGRHRRIGRRLGDSNPGYFLAYVAV
jgi:hypothetical protein